MMPPKGNGSSKDANAVNPEVNDDLSLSTTQQQAGLVNETLTTVWDISLAEILDLHRMVRRLG